MGPGLGKKWLSRVLGIDAAFDGVAAESNVVLADGHGPGGGNQQLFTDQVNAGDLLRDGVLNLDARVHFDECGFMVDRVVEEFDRSGAAVAAFAGKFHGGFPDGLADVRPGGPARVLLQ